MRSPSAACGSEPPNPHASRLNAAHQRWCPGFSRQAWLTECRFKSDTDATDRHGHIAFEPLCAAPAQHAGRNRQACLAECRFELDTDAADRHGYIAVEAAMRSPSGACGSESPNSHAPRVIACTPTLVSRLQPPIMVDGVSIQVDTDATDRHGYIAFEPPCGACGSELPNSHAPRVNAVHQHLPRVNAGHQSVVEPRWGSLHRLIIVLSRVRLRDPSLWNVTPTAYGSHRSPWPRLRARGSNAILGA